LFCKDFVCCSIRFFEIFFFVPKSECGRLRTTRATRFSVWRLRRGWRRAACFGPRFGGRVVCILIYYLSLWRWECCLCWVRFILVSDLFQQERGCILLLHTCKNYHVHLLFLNLLFLFYSVAAVLLLLCSGFVSPREALMRGPSRTKSSRCLLWKRASSESELPSRSESQTHPRWSAKPLLPEEDMHF
jgi:hypothetical protein